NKKLELFGPGDERGDDFFPAAGVGGRRVAAAKCKREIEAHQQNGRGVSDNRVAALPGSLIEIAGTEEIMRHGARESSQRDKDCLLQEELSVERPCGSEQRQGERSIGSDDPLGWELEIEERRECRCSEIRDERIEMEAALAGDVFLISGKLRVHKKENQDERRDGNHAVAEEDAGITSGEIREENTGERGGKSDVRLVAELRNFAQQAVLEKHQAKSGYANGDAERPQLVP